MIIKIVFNAAMTILKTVFNAILRFITIKENALMNVQVELSRKEWFAKTVNLIVKNV
jgi:hypothetical protein